MKEGWMKNDEGWMKNDKVWMKNDKVWMKNDEGWKMNDEGWWFQAVEGFCFMTDWQTDNICDCRVAFATENVFSMIKSFLQLSHCFRERLSWE